VGAVLEGSVRRSGNTVRITAQLINAVTGFHLWSHTYDRDLTDVLKLQSEIAGAVASALKVRLLADTVTKIEVGGTRNPAAFDAYLRASQLYLASQGQKDADAIMADYGEAIRLDPDYALAYAGRSLAFSAKKPLGGRLPRTGSSGRTPCNRAGTRPCRWTLGVGRSSRGDSRLHSRRFGIRACGGTRTRQCQSVARLRFLCRKHGQN